MINKTNSGLREIPDETWHHFFTDELVYAAEPVKVQADFQTSELEGYINANFQVEVFFRLSANSYVVAILQSALRPEDPRITTNTEHALYEARDDGLMLIDTVDFMQPPKVNGHWQLPSMVWLKTFEGAMDSEVDISKFPGSTTAAVLEISGRVENGEFHATSRLLPPGVQQRKLPGQMIQRRAHVESDVSYNGTPFWGRKPMDFQPEDLHKVFTLTFMADGT